MRCAIAETTGKTKHVPPRPQSARGRTVAQWLGSRYVRTHLRQINDKEINVKRMVLFGLVVLGALFSHLKASGQNEANKPAFKNGDTWLFTSKDSGTIGSDPSKMLNGTYEVSIVDGKIKTATVTNTSR